MYIYSKYNVGEAYHRKGAGFGIKPLKFKYWFYYSTNCVTLGKQMKSWILEDDFISFCVK